MRWNVNRTDGDMDRIDGDMDRTSCDVYRTNGDVNRTSRDINRTGQKFGDMGKSLNYDSRDVLERASGDLQLRSMSWECLIPILTILNFLSPSLTNTNIARKDRL